MKEQIQKRGSGSADGQAAELRQKLQEAQEELDTTRKELAAAEKQAAEAERALHRSEPCGCSLTQPCAEANCWAWPAAYVYCLPCPR